MANQILLNKGLTSEIAPTNPSVTGLQNVMITSTPLDQQDLWDLIKFSRDEIVIEGQPTTDDTALWELAQQLALVRGCTVRVKRGFDPSNPTITLPWTIVSQQYSNQASGTKMFSFLVSFDIEAGNIVKYTNGGSLEKGWAILPRSGPVRAERMSVSATGGATRMQVQEQVTGMDTVQALGGSESEASGFSAGDYVKIACGVDVFDTNDVNGLWRHSFIAKVLDANGTTGIVRLDTAIPFALRDGGYDGSTPTTYSTSLSVTADDWVLYSGIIYQALVSGTTSAADPADDGYHGTPTIDESGDGYVQDEVTVVAKEPINGTYVDLGETFTVTVSAGAITAVTPSGSVGGYTSACKLVVISDNDDATTQAELSANIMGVAFKRIANDNGSIEDDRDASPIIQKIVDPMDDIIINGNGSTFIFESEVQSMFNVQAARNSGFKNIKVEGICEYPLGTGEGATNPVYEGMDATAVEEHTTGTPSKSRVFNASATHNFRLINCKGVCGSEDSDAIAVHLDSFSSGQVIDCEFSNRYPYCANSFAVYMGSGKITKFTGNISKGFRYPYSRNQSVEAGFLSFDRDPLRPRVAEIGFSGGNTFHCSAQAFRNTGIHPYYGYPGNDFYHLTELYNSGDIQHPADVSFSTLKAATLYLSFDVTTGSADTWFTLPRDVIAGDKIINYKNHQFIILGQRVHWKLPPESAMLSVKIGTLTDATRRSPFHSSIDSSVEVLVVGKEFGSSETAAMSGTMQQHLFSGAGVRYVDGRNEDIQMYYSLKGPEGGVGYLMLDVLIAEF